MVYESNKDIHLALLSTIDRGNLQQEIPLVHLGCSCSCHHLYLCNLWSNDGVVHPFGGLVDEACTDMACKPQVLLRFKSISRSNFIRSGHHQRCSRSIHGAVACMAFYQDTD
jgi:hypothetical protein